MAEDLAQEVLLVLHQKYSHLDRMEDLLPVAFQILRYKMMAARRKAGREAQMDETPLADPNPNPEVAFARQEMMERLTKALGSLGERCRELFRLKLEGKGYQEIQGLLGVRSINTIYTWDFRCRQQLLELMGGRWEAGR